MPTLSEKECPDIVTLIRYVRDYSLNEQTARYAEEMFLKWPTWNDEAKYKSLQELQSRTVDWNATFRSRLFLTLKEQGQKV